MLCLKCFNQWLENSKRFWKHWTDRQWLLIVHKPQYIIRHTIDFDIVPEPSFIRIRAALNECHILTYGNFLAHAHPQWPRRSVWEHNCAVSVENGLPTTTGKLQQNSNMRVFAFSISFFSTFEQWAICFVNIFLK